MSHDSATPELDSLRLSPDHQARVDADKARTDAAHLAGMERVLSDAQATSRRIVSEFDLPTSTTDLWGEICRNCDERWALPAHKATCAHKPICEDCWPNGCGACEREVEEGIQHRERVTHLITSAALELRTGADDLREADLAGMDWRVRGDIKRHVELTIESLRRVQDVLRGQEKQ